MSNKEKFCGPLRGEEVEMPAASANFPERLSSGRGVAGMILRALERRTARCRRETTAPNHRINSATEGLFCRICGKNRALTRSLVELNKKNRPTIQAGRSLSRRKLRIIVFSSRLYIRNFLRFLLFPLRISAPSWGLLKDRPRTYIRVLQGIGFFCF